MDTNTIINIELPTKKTVINMTLTEFARWGALIEAVEIVSKKASRLGIDTDESNEWIKQGAIERYIQDRSVTIIDDLTR